MSVLDYKRVYRRKLPHIQPPGASFFVTLRLAGTLPQSLVDQWNQERRWLQHLSDNNPEHYNRVKNDFERIWFRKFEFVLDGSTHGPTWLEDDRIAGQLAESLHHRDGKVFRLDTYSIMPNHSHIVIKPLPIPGMLTPDGSNLHHSLASIMKSLKGYTAFCCNRLLEREGPFWAYESYDHYIRNAEERDRIVAYVLNNPVKAGLAKRWRDWKWSYLKETKETEIN